VAAVPCDARGRRRGCHLHTTHLDLAAVTDCHCHSDIDGGPVNDITVFDCPHLQNV